MRVFVGVNVEEKLILGAERVDQVLVEGNGFCLVTQAGPLGAALGRRDLWFVHHSERELDG